MAKTARKKGTPSERQEAIDRILRTAPKHGRTIQSIIQQVSKEVSAGSLRYWSERVIKGDIAEMRKRGAPIESLKYSDILRESPAFYYYEYSDPEYRWESTAVVPQHLFPLKMACAFLSHCKEIKPVRELIDYTKEIERTVPEEGQVQEVPIYFSPLAENQVKPEVWEAALSAATNRRMLSITYRGWKGQSPNEPRRIAPYAIVQLEGEWYIYGTAQLLDDSPRQYKMSRILSAKETLAPFEIPDDMDEIEEILSYSFGQFICADDLEDITVRFKKEVAVLALERQWQAQQNVYGPDEDGAVTITFPVSRAGPWPFYHVIRWILSWGSNIEVLEPQELKDLVDEEIMKMSDGL